MPEETVHTIIRTHATIDASVISLYKDALIHIASQDDPLAPEAATALLRVELTDRDLALLHESLEGVKDFNTRLAFYAILSKYGKVGPRDIEILERMVTTPSDQEQFFLGVIAMHCKLPWSSPIVMALLNRITSEKGEWHRHIHTLWCLLSYLAYPLILQLAESVQLHVANDELLSAVINKVIADARKRFSHPTPPAISP